MLIQQSLEWNEFTYVFRQLMLSPINQYGYRKRTQVNIPTAVNATRPFSNGSIRTSLNYCQRKKTYYWDDYHPSLSINCSHGRYISTVKSRVCSKRYSRYHIRYKKILMNDVSEYPDARAQYSHSYHAVGYILDFEEQT